MKQTTYSPKAKDIVKNWHLYDINGQVLGRAATKIASLLQGKHKPNFAPHLDNGDYVVVINAQKLRLTGRKQQQKVYFRHSGFPGGAKEVPFAKLIKKDPHKVIHSAVSGMLPKNKLRSLRLKRLKVFPGSDHIYQDKFK